MVRGWFTLFKYNRISFENNKINYLNFSDLSIDKLKKMFNNEEVSVIDFLDA